MRGNGERIGPQNLPTSSIAGGIWNLLNQQRAQQRGAWPSATPAVVTDPYFMYVPLLLNTTSTNAQQNNTFLDSSTNNFTITRNGTPTQGSFTPYQPSGYWSGVFNGSTDFLTAPNNTAFVFGSGDFTVETWVFVNSTAEQYFYARTASNGIGTTIGINASGKWSGGASVNGTASIYAVSSANATANTWNHVALTRSSTTLTLWVNGTSVGTNTVSGTLHDPATASYIGEAFPGTNYGLTNGYISNMRVVKGVAVYTGAFTPPTAPLAATQSAGTNISAITGTATSLLACQSNRFIDNSTNAFAITVNGTPKVQAFQPFSPAASYSAATYGGSGYFNGSTDYLTVADATALEPTNQNFCIEAWVYPTITGNFNFYGKGDAATASGSTFSVTRADGAFYIGGTSYSFITTGAYLTNQWNHYVMCRSGTNASVFINGVRISTRSDIGTGSINNTTNPFNIGNYAAVTPLAGYLSNFRYVVGSAVYDPTATTITVPTAPVTAITNTSLLLNMTNAGIYDAAWQNNALTVGDAQVSTTQKQWGTTSMYFDGTGDYLDLGSNQGFVMGSGNWTVEGWVYPTSTSAGHWMYLQGNSTAYGAIRIGCQSNQVFLLISTNGTSFTVSSGLVGSVPINTWTYLAVTRSGGTVTLYVNGTSIYTSTALSTSSLMTGTYNLIGRIDPTNLQYFNGYLQDVRITKGVARTITTPTAAFPTR